MVFVVIMGGGKGTRFWPQSTAARPKQFLCFTGKRSLLYATANRFKHFVSPKRVLIIGNKKHHTLARRELKQLPHNNIIAEPIGRSTAPCLGLASLLVKRRDPNAVIIAVPADAVIKKEKKFIQLVKAAAHCARNEKCFVTLGITPTAPHTGYGYIEIKQEHKRFNRIDTWAVRRFVEKPSLARARQYIASKRFLWNAGIFVFQVETLLAAIKKHIPVLYRGLMTIENALGTRREKAVISRVYSSLKSVSIDYGIMERVSNVRLIKANIGWNDMGSWSALDDVCKKDTKGNIVKGKAIMYESMGNIINADSQLIALLGIHDTIIVQTDKVVLVASKGKAQDVKKIVTNLEKRKKIQYL